MSRAVTDGLRKIGYTYVTVDLLGYRTGSMNEGFFKKKNPEVITLLNLGVFMTNKTLVNHPGQVLQTDGLQISLSRRQISKYQINRQNRASLPISRFPAGPKA